VTVDAELVRDLSRPEAYGEGHTAPVSLRTTHASWVFLTGDEVWKVKRPVDFGFLDFRTLEARHRACEDEVRLNLRLAPDVYLGVAPVRKSASGHHIGGDGPTVDWAVHMRRLPDDASAAALLARGALDPGRLSKIAGRLAPFFAAARLVPELGALAALERNVAENFEQVAPFVGDLLDRETFEDVRAFQLGRLSRDDKRFQARLAGDRIREGHGDLRLEHLYLLPGPDGEERPVIIDCIEFNERFRCGDVASEVAFLAMELEAAGRPDLAAGFLARFAEVSDDFELYGVVDFYLSYRAWVRGKVAAFVAADLSAPPDRRAQKRDEARRDFGLARAFAGRPLDRPVLVAVGGVIGSGKSTLGAGLGRQLGLPVVGSDPTRKALAGLAPTARGDARLYEPERKEKTYAEIFRRAADVLGAGRGVILDATFSAGRWRRAAADLARSTDAAFVFIEASCADAGVLRERLRARKSRPSVSDATDDLLDAFVRDYEPLGASDPEPWFTVDTSGTPERALREAWTRVEALRTAGPAAEVS